MFPPWCPAPAPVLRWITDKIWILSIQSKRENKFENPDNLEYIFVTPVR
jgi:hypothetical protein